MPMTDLTPAPQSTRTNSNNHDNLLKMNLMDVQENLQDFFSNLGFNCCPEDLEVLSIETSNVDIILKDNLTGTKKAH